ncbi:MAG: hypothetical protein AB2421_03410 [Thermotaleaceae bacterium]
MPKKNTFRFGANEAQDLIDTTYNFRDYEILEKDENAYLMPESMQRDVDYIDSTRFYENSKEYQEQLGIKKETQEKN